MIQLNNINVTFETDDGPVQAVKDVSLKVKKGEIFGVIGYSGAGKSTLVRVINMLQRPTSGQVIVGGQGMTDLSEKELLKACKNIGMIFQHFNLLKQRTVGDNIAFPLKGNGLSKAEINDRVDELLELVGLSDRKNAYPAQLSGGQKQRVAIARALASKPDVLLCDEATSALDPKTTEQILSLLQKINEETGITIVVITHEMSVIKKICDRVAVMTNGEVVEVASVIDLFTNPKNKLSHDFIQSSQANLPSRGELGLSESIDLYRLDYIGHGQGESLFIDLYDKFNVRTNLHYSNTEYLKGQAVGMYLVSLEGSAVREALDHIENLGIKVKLYQTEKEGVA